MSVTNKRNVLQTGSSRNTPGSNTEICSECHLENANCRTAGCGYQEPIHLTNNSHQVKFGTAATKVADELENFRAQLGNRLSSHGIILPYTGLHGGSKGLDNAPNGGSRAVHRGGSPHFDKLYRPNTGGQVYINGGPIKRRAAGAPNIACLVDVGPIDLNRVGLVCNPHQFSGLGSGKRSFEQLSILPTIDFGGLDMATMGVRCGPREPRAIPGLAIKRKSKVQTPRDSTSLGRGQVQTTELFTCYSCLHLPDHHSYWTIC